MFASVLFTRAPAEVECFKATADQADLRLALLTCRATVISRTHQLMEATGQRPDGGGCPNGPVARLGLPRTTAVATMKLPGLSLFQASPTLARASRRLLGRDCFQALRKTVNRANQKTHVWAYQTNEAHGYSSFGFTKIHLDESSTVVQPTRSLEEDGMTEFLLIAAPNVRRLRLPTGEALCQ
jgi:hypothetical protein